MYKGIKIAIVIPCYKVSTILNNVLKKIPNFIDNIYLVDDKCPENSVRKIKSKSKKIKEFIEKQTEVLAPL